MGAALMRLVRRLRAASVVLVALACPVLLAPALAAAEPNRTATGPPLNFEPLPSDRPTASQPPVAQSSPPVVRDFQLTSNDVRLGPAYWEGTADTAELVIAVRNAGQAGETITGSHALPAGVTARSTAGEAGCSVDAATFSCTLAPAQTGRVVVQIKVAGDAWRGQTRGRVSATLAGKTKTHMFDIIFPPRPPTPGIRLSASNPAFQTQPTPQTTSVDLTVTFANTGAAGAAGMLDVVTPPGVGVAGFPVGCRPWQHINGGRDRCHVGTVAAGAHLSLVFRLSISVQAQAEAPLSGAVHGFLTPSGQRAVDTIASYEITAPPGSGQSPMPTTLEAATAGGSAIAGPVRAKDASLLEGSQLPVLPIVGGIIALVTAVGAAVVLSLRRRMLDDGGQSADSRDIDVSGDSGDSDKSADSDGSAGAGPSTAVVRDGSGVTRVAALPRLPDGPIAGPAARQAED